MQKDCCQSLAESAKVERDSAKEKVKNALKQKHHYQHFARTPTYVVVLVGGDSYKGGLWYSDLERFVFFSWPDLQLQLVLMHGVQENLQ